MTAGPTPVRRASDRRRALSAALVAGLSLAALTGCVLAPILEGSFHERYERVVPRTTDAPFIPVTADPTQPGDGATVDPEPTQIDPSEVPLPTGEPAPAGAGAGAGSPERRARRRRQATLRRRP